MEAQDGLDELFRSKLEEGHAPVPSFSWEAIQEKVALEKGKKSRKIVFPYFWMAASFVTGLVASGLFFYQYQLETENHYLKELALQNKKEQSAPSDHIATQQSNLNSSIQEHRKESNTENKSKQGENSTLVSEANSNTRSVSNSTLTAQTSPVRQKREQGSFLTSTYSSKEGIDNEGDLTDESNISSASKAGKPVNSSSIVFTTSLRAQHPSSKQGKKEGFAKASSTLRNQGETKQNVMASVSSFSNKKREATISKSGTSSSVNHSHQENISSASTQATLAAPLITEASGDSDKMSTSPIKIDSLLAVVVDSLPKKESVKEKEKHKKEHRLFGLPITFGVYVAPEWASRSLKFSGNEDPELVAYKKNDQHKFGYSAGISLDLKLPERFYLRTGLNYWNVGDQNHTVLRTPPTKSNSSTSNSEKTTTTLIPSSSKDTIGFGPKLSSDDISLISLSREFSSRTKNNYHYLGIPALLGMKLGRSKLSAGIYSGVLVNVLLSPSRSVYYVYYDPQNPDQHSESYRELSRFSLTYWGGLDIDYKLSKNWGINVSPNVKYSLTALYKDRETVRQLPYSFGVQVGCKYSF